MLLHLLNSDAVATLSRNGYCKQQLLDFIKERIDPYKENFAFYLRKYKLHFDEFTSSSTEGMNNAIKHSAAAVQPSQNLEKSLEVLLFQTAQRELKFNRGVGIEKESTQLWTSLSLGQKEITFVGASIRTSYKVL